MKVRGSNDVGSTSIIYAKVLPGQSVVIKVPASAHVAWDNMQYVYGAPILTSWAVAELTNAQATIVDSTGCSSNVSLPAASDSESKTLTIGATAAGEPISIGGEDYYFVGRINLRGHIFIRQYGSPSPSSSFGASVGPVEVRYNGKVLKYESGNGQTRLVGHPLQEPFSVKIIQDDTGAPAADEIVNFEIQEPVNDAVLSAATVVTDSNGIANATLTLGVLPGTYTVRAVCPGCIAGEELFEAVAISSLTDVTGTIPDAQTRGCTHVAIEDKVAEIDPFSNSFRIFNVPLVMNSPPDFPVPEIRVTCNNDAVCPVANARRVPAECSGGYLGASRDGGRRLHEGIDIGIENDMPVLSATNGTVLYAGYFNKDRETYRNYGVVVVIQSTRKIEGKYEVLLYAHLDANRLYVKSGDPVIAGQEIAVMTLDGASGNIRGVLDGTPENPTPRPGCLHVHVERRLFPKPLSIVGLPVHCQKVARSDMLHCDGEKSDMNAKDNGFVYVNTKPTDPDREIGCNLYR